MFNFTRLSQVDSNKGSSCKNTEKSNCKSDNLPKKKPCCVCKETRLARDICISNNGQDKCQPFIDAHNQCLISENFQV